RGGSSNSANSPIPTTAGASTKQQYIAQADAACAALNRIVKGIPTGSGTAGAARAYRQIAAEAQQFYNTFKGIPKPPRDVATLNRYQKNLANSIDITKRVADAVQGKDRKQVTALYAAAKKVQQENTSIAKRYGF